MCYIFTKFHIYFICTGNSKRSSTIDSQLQNEQEKETEIRSKYFPDISNDNIYYLCTKLIYLHMLYTGTIFEPWYFGKPDMKCKNCGAVVWYEERNRKKANRENARFTICCQDGKVKLPKTKETPDFLKELLDDNGTQMRRQFKDKIRKYNSMFSLTSIGAKVDKKINDGRRPYVFRISGSNHHKIGSLLPSEGEMPKFAQMYIYDTEHEVENRVKYHAKPG